MYQNERRNNEKKSKASTSSQPNYYEELVPKESPDSSIGYESPDSQNKFETSSTYIKRYMKDQKTLEQIGNQVTEQKKILKLIIYWVVIIFFMLILIVIFLIYITIITSKTYGGFNELDHELKDVEGKFQDIACVSIPETFRFDCHPEKEETELSCSGRQCCWNPSGTKHSKPQGQDIEVPFCYYHKSWQLYAYENLTKTVNEYEGYMRLETKSHHLEDLRLVKIKSTNIDSSTLRVKLSDPIQKRYEPPWPKIKTKNESKPFTGYALYSIEVDNSAPGFTVKRRSDDTTLFKSNGVGVFIFADQFLEMSSTLPSHNIYGLGEHKAPLKLSTNWKRYTFFNSPNRPKEQTNLYGSHPFYLVIEKSGNCHGVLFLNSNAMDIILNPGPTITFRSIGGIFDFYFFLGPTPTDVLKQYSEVVGKPFLPPYWSLGFHLSRYYYGSLEKMKATWNRTRAAQIPFDTHWNDVDYMDQGNVFTYDKVNYKNLPQFVKELQSQGMHYIPLIDAGISGSSDNNKYMPYVEGLDKCIFIQSGSNKNSPSSLTNCNPFKGKARNPHSTVWPDFTNTIIEDYYTKMLKDLYQNISFDAVWLDTNEPFNLDSIGCPENNLDNPEFVPHIIGESLSENSVCMNAKHHLGSHFNLHNTYGTSQAAITYEVLKSLRNRRPFIISRSTWVGHGSFGGHWTGDIDSSWEDMRASIPHILSFSLFQIPMIGADICGFRGSTTQSLCNRWMQLGAFYPFARNHNSNDTIEQDPVAMGELVTRSSRESLKIRYRLLPYLYTLFFRAHKFGETVARPLFFEFIHDANTYDIDTHFLWGRSLMIIPVLEEGATSVKAYIPQGKWYNYNSNESIISSGESKTLDAPLDKIPLLVRAGSILPEQEPGLTTTESRKNKFGLLVALDEDNFADGELYWDDGDSTDSIEKGNYRRISFVAKNGTLGSSLIKDNRMPMKMMSENESMTLGYLKIMGVKEPVNAVFCNNLKVDSDKFNYNHQQSCLVVNNLEQDMEGKFSLSWTFIDTNGSEKLVYSKLLIILIYVVYFTL